MTQMVRKQIYIEPRQQALLKRLAAAQGISEAELIRQAIDRGVDQGRLCAPPDPRAWEEAHRLMLELHGRGPLAEQGRAWTREDLYEERLSRHVSDPD